MKYSNIHNARKLYDAGNNVTEFLRQQKNILLNDSETIEIAYDLQAGTYSKYALEHKNELQLYCDELSNIINNHIEAGDHILDVGTGELTTLTNVINKLDINNNNIFAFDISWSRLVYGLKYFNENILPDRIPSLNIFCADISALPLLQDSIDCVISSHALEPNGGKERELLAELFRITRKKVILFEPSYEMNSPEGRMRMEKLGYIRNIPQYIDELGGKLVDMIPIKNIFNPFNPTVGYVINPPRFADKEIPSFGVKDVFADPGENTNLLQQEDCFFSPQKGVSYPIIGGIPVLRKDTAILTTAKLIFR